MSDRAPYEEIDHPSDLALRARGRDMAELLTNASRGMIELMLEPGTAAPRRRRPLEVEGDDAEMVLVGWLQEILYAFDTHRFAPARAEVAEASDRSAKGRLWGEPFQDGRHEVRNLIKAVTWHGLSVTRNDGLFDVTIVFDV